ncbi:MAG: hypothetical protein GY775_12025 [Candidatus Scalindua sp.]|nr:hypothetical protein [Candidatus Scalindua sp.]
MKSEINAIIQKSDINESDKASIIDYILSLVKKAHVLLGNHDQRVIGKLNTVMAFSTGISINWMKKIIRKSHIQFFKSLSHRKNKAIWC